VGKERIRKLTKLLMKKGGQKKKVRVRQLGQIRKPVG